MTTECQKQQEREIAEYLKDRKEVAIRLFTNQQVQHLADDDIAKVADACINAAAIFLARLEA